jgi:putative membrane protein (TIGR04086 family)
MKNQRTVHKSVKKNSIKRDTPMDKTLKSSFIGILATVGVGLALMFASTAAALLTDDPTAFIVPIGYVLPFVCAFLGGFVCSKLNKSSPYLVSLICGSAIVLITLVASFLVPPSLSAESNIGTRLILNALTLATFPIGTLIGIKSSNGNKTKHKRR